MIIYDRFSFFLFKKVQLTGKAFDLALIENFDFSVLTVVAGKNFYFSGA